MEDRLFNAPEKYREAHLLFSQKAASMRFARGTVTSVTGQVRTAMEIRLDNLRSSQVIALVREHLASIAPTAPAESRHALDIDGLRGTDIRFWALWDGEIVACIGALKHLTGDHAEIKSMRTADSCLRQGIASRMLNHLICEARGRGIKQLSLETGSMEFFEPARKLYSSFGFRVCGPFDRYVEDPNSVFMTMYIGNEGS